MPGLDTSVGQFVGRAHLLGAGGVIVIVGLVS